MTHVEGQHDGFQLDALLDWEPAEIPEKHSVISCPSPERFTCSASVQTAALLLAIPNKCALLLASLITDRLFLKDERMSALIAMVTMQGHPLLSLETRASSAGLSFFPNRGSSLFFYLFLAFH